MAQTSIRKNVTKTLATAAIGGLMAGSLGFVAGCSHDAGASSPAVGAQHACKGQNACKGQGGCKSA